MFISLRSYRMNSTVFDVPQSVGYLFKYFNETRHSCFVVLNCLINYAIYFFLLLLFKTVNTILLFIEQFSNRQNLSKTI